LTSFQHAQILRFQIRGDVVAPHGPSGDEKADAGAMWSLTGSNRKVWATGGTLDDLIAGFSQVTPHTVILSFFDLVLAFLPFELPFCEMNATPPTQPRVGVK